MKTTFKTLSALVLASTFVLASCIKKTDLVPDITPAPSNPSSPAAPAPVMSTPSDADGACIALNVNMVMTVAGYTVPIELGSALANFNATTGSTVLTNAGTIKANDSLLTNSNNSYQFQPKSVSGIDFMSANKSVWSISGNGSVPAINFTANGFPSKPVVPGLTSASKASSCSLVSASVSNADSVCFQITSGNKSIYKIKAASQTSHMFTAAEMATLDASSNAYVTITAYKFNNTTVGGKKYYFININTSNKMIDVTN